ncbi:unnamed protein product [Schistosoma turkestanicum]|nr:unnamed protein product [Schistosoma turkestanicum]
MVLCLLVLFVFLSPSLSVSYLKFEKISGASEESLVFLNNANPTAILDASASTQRTVYFAQRTPPASLKLTFACRVNRQAKPLDKIMLCCRSSVEDKIRTCVQPKAGGLFSCLNTEFHFSDNGLTGADFSISLTQDSPLSNPISGLFSCVVGADELNVIESNEIEIRDAVYHILQLTGTPSTNIDVVPPISEFPYELKCVNDISTISRWPYWMHQLDSRYGPYRWGYCLTTGKPTAITCSERQVQFPPNSIIEFMNGNGEDMNKRITVNITKLKLNQDCELSIRLQSAYGQSRISTSLRVVPKPQLTISPSDENCIKECDETPFNVSCALDEDLVQEWKSKFSIEPSIDWIIQNHWTKTHLESSGLGQFITLNGGHGKTLTVWPLGKPAPIIVKHEDNNNKQPEEGEEIVVADGIEEEKETVEKEVMNSDNKYEPVQMPSTTTLRQFLTQKIGGSEAQPPKDLILSCWIRLSVFGNEAEFETPNGLVSYHSIARQAPSIHSSGTNRLIYDSRWETGTELAKQLTAIRTFTPDIVPATASLAWIAAVIIGVIILLVVLALSIWLCTRDRGETYMVYDKERAHGNDPLQELREKETFQTFQRQEEPRIATSRYSLNDGSVRYESEDDGELDEYAGIV